MTLPVGREVLAGEVHATLTETGFREAHVRVVVTRGAGLGGLVPTAPVRPTRVIVVSPLTPPPEALYREGVAARFAPVPRWLAGVGGSGAKVCNYVDAILAIARAREEGAHEALFADPHGQVLEGASSNIFAVRGGRLETPPIQAGILGGITRDTVLELARRQGRVAVPRCLFPSDLYGAEEVFLTSSIRELVPVVSIDGAAIGEGRPGPVARSLLAAYREEVRVARGRAPSPARDTSS
jgi:branched-chain amino acid aminotransferase